MKDKLKTYFANVCKETAKLSSCISKQIGAVIVRDNRIISVGYNGVASGQIHCNDIFNTTNRKAHHEWSQKNEIHAEQNAICFCAKSGLSTDGATIFITVRPCNACAKLIIASGIKEVYYLESYDKYSEDNGLELLTKNFIRVSRIKGDIK